MNRILPNNKNAYRKFFVFAAAFLLLLTSCSVKSSIKNLAGIPANTERSVSTNNPIVIGNASEECVSSETKETVISHTLSSEANDLLPVLFLAVAFLFLFAYVPGREQAHPLYSTKKLPGALPLFLQYQHLKLFV